MNITQNNNQKSFLGLTNKFSNRIYYPAMAREIIEKYPKSDGIVGNLPNVWIKTFPKEERKNLIKTTYNEFRKIFSDENFRSKNTISKKLTEFFQNIGIMKKDKSANFEPIGFGAYGKAFKFTDGEKDYVLKRFNNEYEWCMPNHGNFVEQNSLMFINKHSKSADWSKFYFGDLKNKMMISEFIGTEHKKPKKSLNLKSLGLQLCDLNPSNKVNGFNIDAGGIVQVNGIPAHKTSIYISKQISKLANDDEKLNFIKGVIENKKVPNYNEKIIGLANNVVHLKDKTLRVKTFEMLIPLENKDVNETIFSNLHLINQTDRPAIRNKINHSYESKEQSFNDLLTEIYKENKSKFIF